MITYRKGNIFTTECDVIVNTVNCSGVMGAGIAYEFRLRYPTMFERYKELCDKKLLTIGKLWIYELKENEKLSEKYTKVMNFPTKNFWKLPSKIEYIEKGLTKFIEAYQEKNITSIAFPLLGTDKGGLNEENVIKIMEKYLSQLNINVEIWHYDSNASDDNFETFKEKFLSLSNKEIRDNSELKIQYIEKIRDALNDPSIKNMNKLLSIQGIGDVTLEKSFNFIRNYKTKQLQSDLFT